MKQYYIHKNEEQSGPYPEAELLEKLENRELSFNDMCWCEGMEEWQALHETIEMPEMATPPPPPPAPATPPPPPAATPPSPPPAPPSSSSTVEARPLSKEIDRDIKPINWIPALVLMCVTAGLSVIVDIVSLLEGSFSDTSDELAVVALPVFIATAVFHSILHYKCWVAVPEGYREVTPNKAIGFLFIPFFNFYWVFISFLKLVEGLSKAGYDIGPQTKPLAIAYASLFVASLTIGFIPLMGSLIGCGSLAVFIFLFRDIVEPINRERTKSG